MGLVAFWDCWKAGSIPGPAQWVSDPALLQLLVAAAAGI